MRYLTFLFLFLACSAQAGFILNPYVSTSSSANVVASGTVSGGDVSSYTCSFSYTATAGDLIVVAAVVQSLGSEQISSIGSGWTSLRSYSATDIDVQLSAVIASGSETGVTVTNSDTTPSACAFVVVENGTWGGTIADDVGSRAWAPETMSTSIDPAALSPGFTADVYFNVVAGEKGDAVSVSTYPSNMTERRSDVSVSGSSGYAFIGIAAVSSNTSTFNPSAWTTSATAKMSTTTFAIK